VDKKPERVGFFKWKRPDKDVVYKGLFAKSRVKKQLNQLEKAIKRNEKQKSHLG
jgi:hypothetical protein